MALTVSHLNARGEGVAGDLALQRTLPGETVEAGDPPLIITPVADRVAPPCPHFKRCGGCSLQHASDAFVAKWKMARVTDALARSGVESTIAGLHTSPPNTRRRASLKGRKTKKGAQVGLHGARSHDLVAIPNCTLLHPSIMAALPALERLTRVAAPRGGEIGLQVTVTGSGLDLAVSDAKEADLGELAAFAEDFVRITWNGEPALMAARPDLSLGPATVTPPPGAFLQATKPGEAVLIAAVEASLTGAKRIADLFAGLGTFTFPAARIAATDAWEGDPDLIAALMDGARHATGVRAITARRRDLFKEPLSVDELAVYDTVIIDPPRAGAQAQIAELAAAQTPRIVHVSCNPGTFARDAGTLIAAGYRMGPVTVVDQFRWSPHIELVACFEVP